MWTTRAPRWRNSRGGIVESGLTLVLRRHRYTRREDTQPNSMSNQNVLVVDEGAQDAGFRRVRPGGLCSDSSATRIHRELAGPRLGRNSLHPQPSRQLPHRARCADTCSVGEQRPMARWAEDGSVAKPRGGKGGTFVRCLTSKQIEVRQRTHHGWIGLLGASLSCGTVSLTGRWGEV
jgi:hypothetical protein